MTIRMLISGAFALCYCIQAAGQTQTGVFRTTTGNTLYHQFTRTGGGAAVYINQTDSTNAILRLSRGTAAANGGVVLTVENNGNTGIGTLAPNSRLTVAGGGMSLFSALTNGQPRPTVTTGTIPGEIRGMSATSPTMDDGFLRLSAGGGTSPATKSYIDLSGYTSPGAPDRFENIILGTRGAERLRIASSGYVGIGTTDPKQKLSVNGNIAAREIIVTTGGWPDYVFDSSYQLPPLKSVAAHIKKERHLQDVPSAAAIEANGQPLGMINKILLQKIEELTLYLIHQQEQLVQLTKITELLQKRLSDEKK